MIVTSPLSDPVDFEIFTGEAFRNFITGLNYFSPKSNIETTLDDVQKSMTQFSPFIAYKFLSHDRMTHVLHSKPHLSCHADV